MAAKGIAARVMVRAGVMAGVVMTAGSAAVAEPLDFGEAVYKTHASVTNTPAYTVGTPAYFTAGNVVGTLSAPLVGGLTGTVTTTVYRNPDTGGLSFEYVFEGSSDIPSPIVRAGLGGVWSAAAITDAGADAGGKSGSGDPEPEWTDGDPVYLERAVEGEEGVAIQWRAARLGTAIGAGDVSSRVWFETDATVFETAGVGVIDTAYVGNGEILAPGVIGVPLPGAAAMGVVGVGVIAGRRRR